MPKTPAKDNATKSNAKTDTLKIVSSAKSAGELVPESNKIAPDSEVNELKEEVNKLKEENKSNIDKITKLEMEIKAMKTSLGRVKHSKQCTPKEPVKPCTKKKSEVEESHNPKKNETKTCDAAKKGPVKPFTKKLILRSHKTQRRMLK